MSSDPKTEVIEKLKKLYLTDEFRYVHEHISEEVIQEFVDSNEEGIRENFIRHYLIVMVDVLGFKMLSKHLTLAQIHGFYSNLVKRLNSIGHRTVLEIPSGRTHDRPPYPHKVFSDTFVAWVEIDPEHFDVRKSSDFISEIARIFNNCISQGLPIRGGISYGECILTEDMLIG